ncbi:DciA family protein [Rheinheimera maricola]|uniref:DciA family protein n=1 Tax=Rheinheimera maricola TaxID=2793282 RepID=A0ABS7X733_9GAMM|nr:DciA family protein [Rheinheimera maricola]MBZ9611356.1 DciA family protein [Rheinheimera maricola]
MARYTQKPLDISKVLSHSTLASQQQQVALVQQLNKVLAEVLKLEQLSFCQVSCIRDGRAVILSASAPWLTRLKMQRDAILDNFRQKILPDLAGIEIEASPNGQINRPTVIVAQKNSHHLSDNAAAALRAVADNSDGALKQALLKLAENADIAKNKTR